MCGGCGDLYLKLEKVADKKNTFELKGAAFRVFEVKVVEISEPNDNFPNQIWIIKGTGYNLQTRFCITIPEIPNGFVQVAPKPPEMFQLRKGRTYVIRVNYGGPSAAGFRWVAE